MKRVNTSIDMLMSPSNILFINFNGTTNIEEEAKGQEIDKIVKKYREKRKWPKLQVALQNGQYFTLNNTQLHVYRKLEEKGQCRDIKVELVEKRRVPEGILKMMTPPTNQEECSSSQYCSNRSANGYRELETSDPLTSNAGKGSGNNDTDSMSSESIDSDVESVDSGRNHEFDESWESSTDGSTDSELEEEEESLI